jgi:hypothetical protein
MTRVVFLGVMTYWPGLSLWLHNMLGMNDIGRQPLSGAE